MQDCRIANLFFANLNTFNANKSQKFNLKEKLCVRKIVNNLKKLI